MVMCLCQHVCVCVRVYERCFSLMLFGFDFMVEGDLYYGQGEVC